MERTHGIIGHLIKKLKAMRLIANQAEFFALFYPEAHTHPFENNFAATSNAVKYDYFSENTYNDISAQLKDADEFKQHLFRLNGMAEVNENSNEIASFLNYMHPVIVNTTTYARTRIDKKNSSAKKSAFTEFNASYHTEISNYFASASVSVPLTQYIYLAIHWGVLKTLPTSFSFETNYKNQLNEFNEKVVCKYGVNSVPGRRAIMRLASTNMFAMYEAGNFYYYGNTESHIPDYNKALDYFRKSAGLGLDETIDNAHCNPLSLWVISYMYFNYHFRLDLKDVDMIYEIERLDRETRIKFSIRYCKEAIARNGCVPAINMLGLISDTLDEDARFKHSLKAPEHYFLEAAEADYVYAYNNLATLVKRSVYHSEGEEQLAHLDHYLSCLDSASKGFETWASNRLGLFYLTGKPEPGNDPLCFPDYIDRTKARTYFERATENYTDINSAWAYANLMVYFPEKYEKHLELLEQHLVYCCDLYSLAPLKFLCEHFDETGLTRVSVRSQRYLLKVLQRLDCEMELVELIAGKCEIPLESVLRKR